MGTNVPTQFNVTWVQEVSLLALLWRVPLAENAQLVATQSSQFTIALNMAVLEYGIVMLLGRAIPTHLSCAKLMIVGIIKTVIIVRQEPM